MSTNSILWRELLSWDPEPFYQKSVEFGNLINATPLVIDFMDFILLDFSVVV